MDEEEGEEAESLGPTLLCSFTIPRFIVAFGLETTEDS